MGDGDGRKVNKKNNKCKHEYLKLTATQHKLTSTQNTTIKYLRHDDNGQLTD